jgi:hypothetical protein
MSGASTGTVTFTQIDYTAGGLIEGTFADVRLDRDEPDDTVHIVFADGSFHCRVE